MVEHKHKILLVDDEENILLSIKRLLQSEPYDLITTTSASDALDVLKQETISVVISDMRMPGMNGVEFLVQVKKIQPEATRLMLSGYAEKEIIMPAVNEGSIWSFISKPWGDDDELVQRIRNAIGVYDDVVLKRELTEELRSRNENLEEEVARRISEINIKNEILYLLLEGKDILQALDKISAVVKDLTGVESVAILPGVGSTDDVKSIPILKGVSVLGQMVLTPSKELVGEMKGQVNSFATLAAFALSIQKAIDGVNFTMNKDIENFLEA